MVKIDGIAFTTPTDIIRVEYEKEFVWARTQESARGESF